MRKSRRGHFLYFPSNDYSTTIEQQTLYSYFAQKSISIETLQSKVGLQTVEDIVRGLDTMNKLFTKAETAAKKKDQTKVVQYIIQARLTKDQMYQSVIEKIFQRDITRLLENINQPVFQTLTQYLIEKNEKEEQRIMGILIDGGYN